MRNIRPPPEAALCMPYTIQYWQWQYHIKAKRRPPPPENELEMCLDVSFDRYDFLASANLGPALGGELSSSFKGRVGLTRGELFSSLSHSSLAQTKAR